MTPAERALLDAVAEFLRTGLIGDERGMLEFVSRDDPRVAKWREAIRAYEAERKS